jgi:hypothetical protein
MSIHKIYFIILMLVKVMKDNNTLKLNEALGGGVDPVRINRLFC